MSNGRQKNFGGETKYFVQIRANTLHFWLIIKGIQMIVQRTESKVPGLR